MKNVKTKTYSFNWLGLLGIILVVAKIFEIGPIAEWSWWLVLLPFYIWFALVFGLIGIGLAISAFLGISIILLELVDHVQTARKRKAYLARKEADRALNERRRNDGFTQDEIDHLK